MAKEPRDGKEMRAQLTDQDLDGQVGEQGMVLDGDQLGDDQLDAVDGGSDQGYNVVTWDPRGEFASGGVLDARPPI